MTAECALVLPLFLMAVLLLLSSVSLVGDLVAEDLRLSNESRKLAMARSALGGDAVEWIDLSSSVTPTIAFSALPVRRVRASARARVRAWIGFDPSDFPEEGAGDGAGGATVYVTEYESVYHTHADCTHLDLTIIATDTDTVGSLRNEYGDRYRKCDGFPASYSGPVYVTAKGDRYYPSLEYAGLTRHVHITSESEAEGLQLCSRCAERDHAS